MIRSVFGNISVRVRFFRDQTGSPLIYTRVGGGRRQIPFVIRVHIRRVLLVIRRRCLLVSSSSSSSSRATRLDANLGRSSQAFLRILPLSRHPLRIVSTYVWTVRMFCRCSTLCMNEPKFGRRPSHCVLLSLEKRIVKMFRWCSSLKKPATSDSNRALRSYPCSRS
jgi:hypothetical protein